MITELTPEQTLLMDTVREEHINRWFTRPDTSDPTPWVNYIYRMSDMAQPEVVLTSSPMEMQKKGMEITGSKSPVSEFGVFWQSGWVSTYDFYGRIGITTPVFQEYLEIYRNCGVWSSIVLEDTCIVCEHPSAVRRNANNDLHSDQEPAIEWRDGFKLWFLDGVCFEEGLWTKIVTRALTLVELSAIGNADARAVATSFLDPALLLELADAKLLNEGVKGTKLYRVDNFMDTGETQYCMTMVCPSTGRDFLEWVDPEVGVHGDADLAQASAFVTADGERLSIEDYLVMQEA